MSHKCHPSLRRASPNMKVLKLIRTKSVKKTRWVVDSYHDRLKQWHMFKDQLSSNHFIPIIDDLIESVTACLKGVMSPIYKPNPQRDARDQRLAERMQSRLRHESHLAGRVKVEPNLRRKCKAEWKKSLMPLILTFLS